MASLPQSEPLALPWHLHTESHSQDLFSSSLQELRNVGPHLYSAAQYYEVAYLHSNEKKAVIESLKDYSAKALVNALDHLGTVASQLNECLSLHTANISNMELRTTSITQRLRTCHERMGCEGLRQFQQMLSRRPHYHKHYNPADTFAEKQFLPLLQLSPGKLAEIFQANVGSDSNTLKSLSWYLAFESSSSGSGSVANATRSSAMEFEKKSFSAQGHFFRSLSSGQKPLCSQGSDSAVKDTSKSLRSLMMSDVVDHKEEISVRKNPFASLFGKNRRGKSKSFDLSKH